MGGESYDDDDYKVYHEVDHFKLYDYQKKMMKEMAKSMNIDSLAFASSSGKTKIVKEKPNNAEEYIRSLA